MSMCEPGVKLYDVAQEVEGYIREHGCKLAFPCNISINETAAHHTPGCNDKDVFEVGDIVKIDCGAILDGYIGDTAGTVEVGSRSNTELVQVSKTARDTVAEFIGEGVPLCEIGRVVDMTMRRAGFVPITNLCGHQIAKDLLHAGFSVPNYDNGDDYKLESGTIVAIEPFATNGKGQIKNGRPGNIVRILRERPLSDPKDQEFYEYAKEEFFQQPFCARSCDFPDAEKRVRSLIRHGVLSSYAELVEVGGGLVSQHEYTFYIDGKHGEVTTLP